MKIKKYLTAFAMTQSMFCAIPFPFHIWEEKARPYMMFFLPVIGLEIGLLWVALDKVLGILDVPYLIYGLAMCAFPYLLTGFIHLDGFMDVTDAICSWRDLEQRRTILKDSHVGSFAVIWCIFLMLAGFSLFASSPDGAITGGLALIPVISRCCSAFFVMHLKPMVTSQYAQSRFYPKWHRCFYVCVVGICVAGGFLMFGKYGWTLVAGLVGYIAALWRSYRLLEGMNGDISGFCLTISELCAVAVYVLI